LALRSEELLRALISLTPVGCGALELQLSLLQAVYHLMRLVLGGDNGAPQLVHPFQVGIA
jgi:hypothetical protein